MIDRFLNKTEADIAGLRVETKISILPSSNSHQCCLCSTKVTLLIKYLFTKLYILNVVLYQQTVHIGDAEMYQASSYIFLGIKTVKKA